jgi:hypothetical protein
VPHARNDTELRVSEALSESLLGTVFEQPVLLTIQNEHWHGQAL